MKVHGTYINKIISETPVSGMGNFTAFVIEGIENFNSKTVFMASVKSLGRSSTGDFYDNFEEARDEANKIIVEMDAKLKLDEIEWEKEYNKKFQTIKRFGNN